MLEYPKLKEILDKSIKVEELREIIGRLDWIKIMDKAIKSRPTSWDDNPIREWRNASDCVYWAVMDALEKELYKKFKRD